MSAPAASAIRLYRVSGRVQGVYYRASAQARARELGLRGWVRNLADGRVEALAAGPAAALAEFAAWLAAGPPRAQVSGVEVAPGEGAGTALPAAFEVR